MTPKEKAIELYQKYYNKYGYYGIPVDAVKHSKECANICIDELMNSMSVQQCNEDYFWENVKHELKLL